MQYYWTCHVGSRWEGGYLFERRVDVLSHLTGSSASKGVLDFLKDIILTNIFYGLENSFVLIF